MEHIEEINDDESIFISKDNAIVKVNKELLMITGYTESDFIGHSLEDVSRLLRIDSQIKLQYINDAYDLYIFNNLSFPINVTITCKISVKKNIRTYYIKEIPQMFLRNMLLNFDDFSISDKQALAVYSYPDCICLKINKKYINSLDSININSDNPIGKPYPYLKYTSRIINEGSFCEDEVEFINSNGIVTYWDMSMRIMYGDENKKYLILSLFDVNNKVVERKLNDKKRIEMEIILESISDVITIVNNEDKFIYVNKAGIDKLSPYTDDVNSLDFKKQFELFNLNDIHGNKLSYEETPIQRVLRGEKITNEIIIGTSHLPTTYHECIGIPIYDELGNINSGILTYRDVGDRVKVEVEKDKSIKTQYELLSKIVESLELEYIRCSYPDLNILSINEKSFNNLKEINKEIKYRNCVIGKNFFEVYQLDEETKRNELSLYISENEINSYISYNNGIINGEERFFKTTNLPLLGSNNSIVEIVFITTDITVQIKEKNEIIATLDMQNQMFSIVSHELKTPLSVILAQVNS